jgi:hypothetical protein
MNHLYKTIIDNDKGYTINKDYKYFMTNISHNDIVYNKHKSIIKKELFLTFIGMLRLIHVSRNNKFDKNIYIIKKWLDNFDKTSINKYIINIDKNEINNYGCVYIVTSNILNAVKIGMWRASISSLYSRYTTCYGSNINIDYFYTKNVRLIERNVHTFFDHYRITNELFKKEYYSEYINYIKNNINI